MIDFKIQKGDRIRKDGEVPKMKKIETRGRFLDVDPTFAREVLIKKLNF